MLTTPEKVVILFHKNLYYIWRNNKIGLRANEKY